VIADNDPEVLDLLASDLRASGHEVVGVAASGEAALALCAEHRPDVLVVDYRMPPGLNGLETAARLRETQPDVHIILYTNYRKPDIRRESARLGVVHLLKGNIRALRRAVADGSAPSGEG
jgi:CheY-like chemotaxis protein